MIKYIFLPVLILLFSSSAFAQELRITEFMYDAEGSDVGKEYIEVLNYGATEVDMSEIKFVEHGRTHSIKEGIGGSLLSPGGISIIVDKPELFSSYYDFDGIVLNGTGFSLNNTSSTIQLTKEGYVIYEVEYSKENGGNGDGNSLHVSYGGNLTSGNTSIGDANLTSAQTLIIKEKVSNIETNAITFTKNDSKINKISKEISSSTMIENTSGILFEKSVVKFSAVKDGINVYGMWNFGDSNSIYGEEVEHRYNYSGRYIVTFRKLVDNNPSEIGYTKEILIIKPVIKIVWIDSENVKFINEHSFKIDISNWVLSSESETLEFPKGSIIVPKGNIIVPIKTKQINAIYFSPKNGGKFIGKEKTEIKNKKVNKKEKNNILIWFSLFVGLIIIVVAPLFLAKED